MILRFEGIFLTSVKYRSSLALCLSVCEHDNVLVSADGNAHSNAPWRSHLQSSLLLQWAKPHNMELSKGADEYRSKHILEKETISPAINLAMRMLYQARPLDCVLACAIAHPRRRAGTRSGGTVGLPLASVGPLLVRACARCASAHARPPARWDVGADAQGTAGLLSASVSWRQCSALASSPAQCPTTPHRFDG